MLLHRVPPVPDKHTAFFWASGADGVLRILRCTDCWHFLHPPTPRCTRCHSERVQPEPVSGRGRVQTFTVNHQEWVPGQHPYIVAKVELLEQEGLCLETNLVEIDGDDVCLGMPVEVVFEPGPTNIWYPLFRPVSA